MIRAILPETRGRGGWRGQRVFEIPRELVDSLVPADGTPWPDPVRDVNKQPVVVGHVLQRDYPKRKTHCRLTVMYKTLTWLEVLEQRPNKGVLSIRHYTVNERLKTKPVEGWPGFKMAWTNPYEIGVKRPDIVHRATPILEGPDPTDPTGQSKYVITAGSNIVSRGMIRFMLDAVVSNYATFVTQFQDKLGFASITPMSMFWGATGQRQTRLMAIATSPYTRSDKHLHRVQYYFLGKPEGWSQYCESTKYENRAIQQEILDSLNVGTERFSTKHLWLPTSDVMRCDLMEYANFSPINSMVMGVTW
jgi:hypothetical protein